MGSLAKKDLHVRSSRFYRGDSSSPSSDQGSYGYEEEKRLMEKTVAAPLDIIVNKHSAFLGGSVAATDVGFRTHHHLSLINFKNSETTDCFGHATGAGSQLSFQQEPKSTDSFIWKNDAFGNNTYNSRQVISTNDLKSACSESCLLDEINNYQPPNTSYDWLYSDSTVVTADRAQETRAHEGSSSSALLKRPYMGDDQSMSFSKKQSVGSGSSSSKNSKSKLTSSNKDPQSIAAKNRRERISERLKVLQELVPNCPKVDLVTMLEKAISYVKFLQLQVKVLATMNFGQSKVENPLIFPRSRKPLMPSLHLRMKEVQAQSEIS